MKFYAFDCNFAKHYTYKTFQSQNELRHKTVHYQINLLTTMIDRHSVQYI
jgi:hypothetical protein